jgi:hypothetical protein
MISKLFRILYLSEEYLFYKGGFLAVLPGPQNAGFNNKQKIKKYTIILSLIGYAKNFKVK